MIGRSGARTRLLGDPDIEERQAKSVTGDPRTSKEKDGSERQGISIEEIEELEQQPSSLDNKNSVNFLFPTTNPIGRGQFEIGFAKISGTGVVEIPFESDFVGKPTLVQTSFGFISFWFPVGFSWDYSFTRTFFDFDIEWTEIRLPSFSFLWSVEDNQFSIFNAWGETWVSYIAVER